MKNNKTLLVFLLDESGSMDHLRAEVIKGINSLIEDQKKNTGETLVSMAMFDYGPFASHFDGGYRLVYDMVDINSYKPITEKEYHPRGSTALYDSTCYLIDMVGQKLAEMPEAERPERVQFCIQSDGFANADTKFGIEQVRERIKHQTEKYNWDFIFLGANFDATAFAANIGVSFGNSMTYTASNAGTKNLYGSTSNLLRAKRSVSAQEAQTVCFSAEDRDAAIQ